MSAPTVSIVRTYRISAAHRLHGLGEKHKCARLHGHNYTIELHLRARSALVNGMVKEAGIVDIDVRRIVQRLDHITLNDFDDGGSPHGRRIAEQPTAENIALYLWDQLAYMRAPECDAYLSRVVVIETDDLRAEVSE